MTEHWGWSMQNWPWMHFGCWSKRSTQLLHRKLCEFCYSSQLLICANLVFLQWLQSNTKSENDSYLLKENFECVCPKLVQEFSCCAEITRFKFLIKVTVLRAITLNWDNFFGFAFSKVPTYNRRIYDTSTFNSHCTNSDVAVIIIWNCAIVQCILFVMHSSLWLRHFQLSLHCIEMMSLPAYSVVVYCTVCHNWVNYYVLFAVFTQSHIFLMGFRDGFHSLQEFRSNKKVEKHWINHYIDSPSINSRCHTVCGWPGGTRYACCCCLICCSSTSCCSFSRCCSLICCSNSCLSRSCFSRSCCSLCSCSRCCCSLICCCSLCCWTAYCWSATSKARSPAVAREGQLYASDQMPANVNEWLVQTPVCKEGASWQWRH